MVGLGQFNEPLEHLVVHGLDICLVKLEKANKKISVKVRTLVTDGVRVVGFLCPL